MSSNKDATRAAIALLGLILVVLSAGVAGDGVADDGVADDSGERTPQAPPEPGEAYEDAPGVIRKVGNLGFAVEPDEYPGTRYVPDKLPDEFKEDGLKVLFSGVVQEAPPGVRMWGTPLKLTAIRRREDDEARNSVALLHRQPPECDKKAS
jgi:hypothetical protein